MEVVFVPVILWVLVVGAYFGIRHWRSVSFVVTLVVGGVGLVIWSIAMIGMFTIPDDGGGLGSYGAAIGYAFYIVVGGALLLLGALIGLVSVLVQTGSNVDGEGQPKGPRWPGEGPGRQLRPPPGPEEEWRYKPAPPTT